VLLAISGICISADAVSGWEGGDDRVRDEGRRWKEEEEKGENAEKKLRKRRRREGASKREM
jgi:hypothetical protein